MSADTKTVDVLAVLRTMAREAMAWRNGCAGDSLISERQENAIAAIAELIERERVMRAALVDLKAQCARNLELGATGTGYWTDAQDTVDAALRACGGA